METTGAGEQKRAAVIVLDGFGFHTETELHVLTEALEALAPSLRDELKAELRVLSDRDGLVLTGDEADRLLLCLLAPIRASSLALARAEKLTHIEGAVIALWSGLRESSAYRENAAAIADAVHGVAGARNYLPWCADMPYLIDVRNEHATWITGASGIEAGFDDLNPAVQGNSEAGHQQIMNLSVALQPDAEISASIAMGDFFDLAALQRLKTYLEHSEANLNFCFLLSGEYGDDGRVHSSWSHMVAFLDLIFGRWHLQPSRVRMQAILDGRDSPPYSAVRMEGPKYGYLPKLISLLEGYGAASSLAWVIGRATSMDRDYDEVKAIADYRQLVDAAGEIVPLDILVDRINAFYDEGKADTSIPPLTIPTPTGELRTISNGDVFLDLNFRADRQRQKIASLIGADDLLRIESESRNHHWAMDWMRPLNLKVVTMTEYDPRLGPDFGVDVLFPILPLPLNLIEILTSKSKDQFKVFMCAESNKSLHVGYFVRGRREALSNPQAERRIIVPSYGAERGVTSDDDFFKTPQMKVFEVAGTAMNELSNLDYDLAIVNLSSADMLGHLNPKHSAESKVALQYLDRATKYLTSFLVDIGYDVIITADHGNIEELGSSHTNNDVYTTLVSRSPRPIRGQDTRARLFDIPWTVASLLGRASEIEPYRDQIPELVRDANLDGKSLVESTAN